MNKKHFDKTLLEMIRRGFLIVHDDGTYEVTDLANQQADLYKTLLESPEDNEQ